MDPLSLLATQAAEQDYAQPKSAMLYGNIQQNTAVTGSQYPHPSPPTLSTTQPARGHLTDQPDHIAGAQGYRSPHSHFTNTSIYTTPLRNTQQPYEGNFYNSTSTQSFYLPRQHHANIPDLPHASDDPWPGIEPFEYTPLREQARRAPLYTLPLSLDSPSPISPPTNASSVAVGKLAADREDPDKENEAVKSKLAAPKPAAKSKKNTGANPKKRARKTGTGSKSGAVNRRDEGGSDAEIKMLSKEESDAAGLKDPDEEIEAGRGVAEDDKVKLVEWLTEPERWSMLRLKQQQLFITAASDLFNGLYSATQLSNYWKLQAWEKYKAVRERQEHTGGGDGDADRMDEEQKGRVSKRGRNKFSEDVLDAFETSK
ncbi:hypothetical protein EV360DRAFT_90833, partial [Lentinula raphanica]